MEAVQRGRKHPGLMLGQWPSCSWGPQPRGARESLPGVCGSRNSLFFVRMRPAILKDPAYEAFLSTPRSTSGVVRDEHLVDLNLSPNRSKLVEYCICHLSSLAFLDYVAQKQQGDFSSRWPELHRWNATLVNRGYLQAGVMYVPIRDAAARRELSPRGQLQLAPKATDALPYPKLRKDPHAYNCVTADFIQYLKELD